MKYRFTISSFRTCAHVQLRLNVPYDICPWNELWHWRPYEIEDQNPPPPSQDTGGITGHLHLDLQWDMHRHSENIATSQLSCFLKFSSIQIANGEVRTRKAVQGTWRASGIGRALTQDRYRSYRHLAAHSTVAPRKSCFIHTYTDASVTI